MGHAPRLFVQSRTVAIRPSPEEPTVRKSLTVATSWLGRGVMGKWHGRPNLGKFGAADLHGSARGLVATVSAFLTVGFSPAHPPWQIVSGLFSGAPTWQIVRNQSEWGAHLDCLSKAERLQFDHRGRTHGQKITDRGYELAGSRCHGEVARASEPGKNRSCGFARISQRARSHGQCLSDRGLFSGTPPLANRKWALLRRTHLANRT